MFLDKTINSWYHLSTFTMADILPGLRGLQPCPLCKTAYVIDNMRVVEEDCGAQLVHMTCGQCQNSVLAFIVDPGLGVGAVGMLTDLSESDVLRLRDSSGLDENAVIDFAQMIRKRQKEFIYHFMKD